MTGAQPHLSTIGDVIIALAHNGTLVNSDDLRRQLIDLGVPFLSNTDSEVATRLIGYFTQNTSHIREGIRHTMEMLEGGYAMALINDSSLYAFRDPHGIRPLVLGELPEGAGWCVASETCALDIVGARFVRDVRPGEVLRVNAEGLVSEQAVPARERALCVFEHVYFARPDTVMEGDSIYAARVRMGRSSPRTPRPTPIWSSPCPTRARLPPRGSPTRAGSSLARASSRTVTSGAPSSSRRRSCARWACA